MLPQVCIIAGGALCLAMAIFHTRFPKLFGWAEDFNKIRLANKRIFTTIHIALILMFIIFAAVSICFSGELSRPGPLPTALLLLFSAFWVWRTVWQFIYFKIPKDAPRSASVMKNAQSAVFILMAALYLAPVLI